MVKKLLGNARMITSLSSSQDKKLAREKLKRLYAWISTGQPPPTKKELAKAKKVFGFG